MLNSLVVRGRWSSLVWLRAFGTTIFEILSFFTYIGNMYIKWKLKTFQIRIWHEKVWFVMKNLQKIGILRFLPLVLMRFFFFRNQRDNIQRGPLWQIDLTQPASLRPLASYLQFRVMYFKVKTLEEIWKNFVSWGGLEPLTLPWIWHTCALYQLSYCGLILNPTDPWFV